MNVDEDFDEDCPILVPGTLHNRSTVDICETNVNTIT